MFSLIRRFGYAEYFASWDISMRRQVLGLLAGFLMAAGFYIGLARLQVFFFPLVAVLASAGLVVAVKKARF